MELGALGDGDQGREGFRRHLLWRLQRGTGFDRLQRSGGLGLLGVALVDGVRQLVDRAPDPGEQCLIDEELSGRQAGETGAVEGDVPLGPDEVAVGVRQGRVGCVEETGLAVPPQRLDAAPCGCLDPVVEHGARVAVGRGCGR
ncbi:hypothetical protein ACFWBR_24940 [Streptomyces sp. NPDC060006]|uniref:hypothetical protein n=1 Tax=unclassified Streptomyces TaxID=2593676 RepID=UPI0036C1CF2C